MLLTGGKHDMSHLLEAQNVETAPAGKSPSQSLRGGALASVLGALLLALFLSGLDQIIVDTALPHIIGDLHGFDRYTWVVTAYLLASTATIPIAGKLSDQFGRKWLLAGGVAVFIASSAVAGASQTMNQLIVFRGLQGLSGGAIQTLVYTLLADIFPPAVRARFQGIGAGVFALASVVGPAAGGWITDNWGWRWVFYVNIPLDLLALAAIVLWLPFDISERTSIGRGWASLRRVDVLGALTAAGATACLLLGLTWGGQTYPWTAPQVTGTLAASAALFVAFLIAERFAADPILPLGLARNQVFAAGALLSLTANMALLALLVYIPLFIQGVLGQSATSSGVVVTPLTVSVTVAAVVSGQMVARTHRYQWVVVLGAVVFGLGAFLMTRIGVTSQPVEITRNMVVLGIGVGMMLPILTVAVQNAIPRRQLGAGTGAVSYLRSLGSTLGVAVIGAVVNDGFSRALATRLPPAAHLLPRSALEAATSQQVLVNPGYRAALTQGIVQGAVQRQVPQIVAQQAANIPPSPRHDALVAALAAQAKVTVTHEVTALLQQVFEATRQALAVGIEHAFWVALGICGVVFIVALFLKDVPLGAMRGDAKAETAEV
jgi:EmrB/QacA subfamily drug resistance transporter